MGIYKRGKVWWMAYTVPAVTEDGIEYKNLVRESTGMRKKEQAEEVWADVVKSLKKGTYVPEPEREPVIPHPFDVATETYLVSRQQKGKRDDSYRKLADWVKVLGKREIASITLDDVETQLSAWMKERKWAPATYNNSLSQLSGVFSFAYRKGWIKTHPLRGRAEQLDTYNERQRYFYPHELDAMKRTAEALARLQKQPATWLRDIIAGAAYTGLRRGNLCACRCRDVRRDENGELWLLVSRDKNGRPLEKRLLGEVQEIAKRRLERKAPGAFLFPGPDQGNAYTSVGRYLPIVVEHVGKRHPDWGLRWGRKEADGVTFHSFRHAMASLALNAGVPRDVVKRLGNWKTDAMVERYAHRADEHVRAAEERLAGLLHTISQSQRESKDRKRTSA